MRRRKDAWAWGQMTDTFEAMSWFLQGVHEGMWKTARQGHESMLYLPEFE